MAKISGIIQGERSYIMAREKVYSVSHNECERTSIGTLEYVLSEKCEVCDEPFIEEEKSFCRD